MKRLLLATLAALLTLTLVHPNVEAANGDLSLSEKDVWFSTDSYIEGNTIRIWSSVSNGSSSDLLGSVHFTANGKQIGSDQPISALAQKTDDVFVDWVPQASGNYQVTVSLSAWDNTGDNPNNNSVTKQVYVNADTDRDGIANSVDPDDDNDGITDEKDAFPLNKEESLDTDGDGTGNKADTDDDNDGTLDSADQLPLDARYTKDQDGDGLADEVDEDIDGDGLKNTEETLSDPKNPDSDGDLKQDGADQFPNDAKEWADLDGDKIGDNSDPDIDNDGTPNETDKDPSNRAPSAEADVDVGLASLDEEVTFDASDSNDDGEIVKYVWQIGDKTLEGEKVSARFDTAGLKTATLTVYDANGQSASKSLTVRVFDKAFWIKAGSFSFLILLLAFYTIYRYNRRALRKK